MTNQIRTWAIVIEKYLACATVLAIMASSSEVLAADMSAPECKIGGADALARCLEHASSVEDKHLNALYGLLMRMLDEAVDSDHAFFADKKNSLIVAERAWIKFRDAQCAAEADLHGPGSASLAVQVTGDCYLKMTQERIAWLREMVSMVKPDSKLCEANATACEIKRVE